MFLKSLTLKGFKSFADATTLELEPGVTVVVGPNGSGKSNVVDAIGWVLGAQAPSTVRSQRMDDVIFAGTAKRAALGRAEVSLTIDNSSGLLPIEFTEVTITRILFRSGDSEYSINGVPCRLLDIQELLSDSGVGRHQHVIVSQGQIDAVLNARPEDRRLIVEEAAGVLKYRRRKERSERRLQATEANLVRLQDMLREVRRQLRPLEKQADAARRHGEVIAELTRVRTHVAGVEVERLQARLEQGRRTRHELDSNEAELRRTLARLDTEVMATESKLTAMGGDDLGDALMRFDSLRERARGLVAVLSERRRGIERDRAVSIDEGVVASLDAEGAEIEVELVEVDQLIEAFGPEIDAIERSEADLAVAEQDFLTEWSDGVPTSTGAAAEVRGELAAVRASVERNDTELDRARRRLERVEEKIATITAEAERLAGELEAAQADVKAQPDAIAAAETRRRDAEAALEAAEDDLQQVEAEQLRWRSRADALALALDEARAAAGAELLAEVDGMLGTLLDVVEVDAGWEAAFEAAVADAITAVIVESVDAGRIALARLRDADAAGAVIALGAGVSGARIERGDLRAHVRGIRPGVEDLLDVLVGGCLIAEDWAGGVDLALQRPDALVVTRGGDRFGPSGWRIGAHGSGATGAALEEARRAADEGEAALADARERVQEHRPAVTEAGRAETELNRAADRTRSRIATLEDGVHRTERDAAENREERERVLASVGDWEQRAERDLARLTDLEARLPGLEAADNEIADRSRAMADARARLDDRARTVARTRTDLDVRRASLDERRRALRHRSEEIETRLSRHAEERRIAERRRLELDRKLIATDALIAHVEARLVIVDSEVGALRERRRVRSEASREVTIVLDALRKERSEAERALAGVRERIQRNELEDAEIRVRLESAVESLRRDLDIEPEAAMGAPAPELPEGVTPAARVRELERDLRLMGPINPLAVEEYEAQRERHEFLQGQLDDVKSTRRDLTKVIRAIDTEIVAVFAAAFAEVSTNYEHLFETLFPGGRGRLQLTEPENLLETGVEIEARPSGKNVRKLSLLSGGERSLTALAFLFAIFRARPSPFYVMDEVEAALDDVNLSRFLGLMAEFRDDAQLLVVSHQKRTMEAADCLYGVSMAPGGSSKVVSERATTD